MNGKIIRRVRFLAVSVLILYLYTFIHEMGHGLVAIACGGRILKIVLGVNAHIRTAGASYTVFTKGLFNAMGALLPVIVLVVALICYNKNRKSNIYHFGYSMYSLGTISSLFAWVVIPVVFLNGNAPKGDDVTKFLTVTNLNPLYVSAGALILIGLLIVLVIKRGVISRVRQIVVSYNDKTSSTVDVKKNSNPKNNRAVKIIIGCVFLISGICVLLGYFNNTGKVVFKTNMSLDVNENIVNSYSSFNIEKDSKYDANIIIDANGIITDFKIYDEKKEVIYENMCGKMKVQTIIELKKGRYKVEVTSIKDIDTLKKYVTEKGYTFGGNLENYFDSVEKYYQKNDGEKSDEVTIDFVLSN